MKFKVGDRVHVLRFSNTDVDFYGTLKRVDGYMANLFDCTNKKYDYTAVFLPSDDSFGEDKDDYYVLAEDEEDTKGGNNMPTIKTKKEMNLPELIEWGWKNKIKNLAFYSNKDGGSVYFNKDGVVYVEHEIDKIDTFTVEIEEEITEDTVIHKLIELSDKGLLGRTILNINSSINIAKTEKSVAFYILNDDLTMTLIWRDGKLVE